jgi:hypothetical protein
MEHLKTTSLLVLSVMLLFASCSIEKRVHMSGYHKSNKSIAKNENISTNDYLVDKLSINKIETLPNQMDNELEMFASSSNNMVLTNTTSDILKKQKTTQLSQVSAVLDTDCDIIILKNGQEILAKVLEVGLTEVKYKNCDNQNGPVFSKRKSEIFMIRYPNGTSTVIEDSKNNSSKVPININSNSNPTNKSLVVAVALWFFLGLLGIHRFYLGHIGMGILYLLTGALCGIGWLIDGILLLTGGLKPKNGDFTN